MAYITWKFIASYIFDIKHLILQWIQFRVYILENRKLQILGKFFFSLQVRVECYFSQPKKRGV